jgi:hypothetical protein
MIKNTYIILIFLFIIFCSCNDNFSPYCEMEFRHSLLCILTNQTKDQYVIAQRLHHQEESGKMPPNTKIMLTSQNGYNYTLNETTIEGNDNLSFYKTSISLYRGLKYRLSLVVDSVMVQWAETFIPQAYVTSVTPNKVTISGKLGETTVFSYKINLSSTIPEISIVKMFIEYEITGDEGTTIVRDEVPISLISSQSVPAELSSLQKWELGAPYVQGDYTGVVKNGVSPYYRTSSGSKYISFPEDGFLFVLNNIPHKGKPENIKIKRGYVVSYGLEKILYDNYVEKKTSYSVRLDQPFIPSNFRNLNESRDGLFSFITSDTLKFNIYPEMFSNFGYKDGQ